VIVFFGSPAEARHREDADPGLDPQETGTARGPRIRRRQAPSWWGDQLAGELGLSERVRRLIRHHH
jgi:hypothetical protein